MIYLDCSVISRLPEVQTGIQRVTRELAAEMVKLSREVCLAEMRPDGVFFTLSRVPQVGDIPHIHHREPIFFEPGDVYLVLDSLWVGEPLKRLNAFRPFGLITGVVYYDLIPVTHPELCGVDEKVFTSWLKETAQYADFFASISASTQDVLHREVQKVYPERRLMPDISFHFPLGADLPVAKPDEMAIREEMRRFFREEKPYLIVSTVEVRKNHTLLLDAFDRLWKRFPHIKLCFIGRQGWMVDDLLRRIAEHPQLHGRFEWFQDCSDEEVAWAYQHAKCTLNPSFEEGFGLPIIESLHAGTPVLASEIDIFQEVGGSHIGYFSPHDASSLIAWIEQIETTGFPDFMKAGAAFPWPDWQSSAEILLEKIKAAAEAAAKRAVPALQKHRKAVRRLLTDAAAKEHAAEAAPVARVSILRMLRMPPHEMLSHAYSRFLRRPLDSGGKYNWLHHLSIGVPPLYVITKIRFSSEGREINDPVPFGALLRWFAGQLNSKNIFGKFCRYVLATRWLSATHGNVRAALIQHHELLQRHDAIEPVVHAHSTQMAWHQNNLQLKTNQMDALGRSLREKNKQIRNLEDAIRFPDLPFAQMGPVPSYLENAEKRVGAKAPRSLEEKEKQFYTYFSEIWEAENEAVQRQHHETYLPLLAQGLPGRVLDLGCGAGEFLSFLKAHGIAGQGVDLDANEVARATARGVDAACADAFAFLRSTPERYGAISLLQVIEHIPQQRQVELISLARECLAPGGLLLVETINPMHPAAFSAFYSDPTHERPVPLEYLAFLTQWCGFEDVHVIHLLPRPMSPQWVPLPGCQYLNYTIVAKAPEAGRETRI